MSYAQWILAALALLALCAFVWFMIDRKGKENPETIIPDDAPIGTKGGGGGPQQPL